MSRRPLRLLALLCLLGFGTQAVAADCVVLLHGLGRSSWSLLRLERALQAEGYAVWNESYPSTRETVERLAAAVGDGVAGCRQLQPGQPIHFVTHSMGGILVRAYFETAAVPEARRVVMLAPPNHGSEIVDAYRDRWWFRQATGPAGQQLGTESGSLPNRLAPLRLEVGIVAGTRSSDPWFGGRFAGPHDGKVSVASTRLPEMTDLLMVDSGHTFIMNSRDVIRQVQAFLRSGRFVHENTASLEKP